MLEYVHCTPAKRDKQNYLCLSVFSLVAILRLPGMYSFAYSPSHPALFRQELLYAADARAEGAEVERVQQQHRIDDLLEQAKVFVCVRVFNSLSLCVCVRR